MRKNQTLIPISLLANWKTPLPRRTLCIHTVMPGICIVFPFYKAMPQDAADIPIAEAKPAAGSPHAIPHANDESPSDGSLPVPSPWSL